MAGRFDGQVAIVTGGGRGIGRSVALLLAAEGAKIIVCDLGGEVRGGGADSGVAESVVREIEAAGGQAIANSADLATMDGAKSAVDAAIDNFGRIDILFNGAAIVLQGRVHELDEQSWDSIVRVNLKSAFAMTHFAAPHMMRQGKGSIINVTSPSALGHSGMSAYATSKLGLVAFSSCIARELGEHGIRCNVILPCAMTRMGDVTEIGDEMLYCVEQLGLSPLGNQWLPGMNGQEPQPEPENAAAVVAWLCTPETEALNARILYISGGHLAIFNEPELIRARFLATGWDLDSLMAPQTVAHFTYGQFNPFTRRKHAQPAEQAP